MSKNYLITNCPSAYFKWTAMILFNKVIEVYSKIDNYIIDELEKNESLIGFSKWGSYLPIKYKCEIVKERYFDFESAVELLNNIKLVEMV